MAWFRERRERRDAERAATLTRALAQALTETAKSQAQFGQMVGGWIKDLVDLSVKRSAQLMGARGGRITQERKRPPKPTSFVKFFIVSVGTGQQLNDLGYPQATRSHRVLHIPTENTFNHARTKDDISMEMISCGDPHLKLIFVSPQTNECKERGTSNYLTFCHVDHIRWRPCFFR